MHKESVSLMAKLFFIPNEISYLFKSFFQLFQKTTLNQLTDFIILARENPRLIKEIEDIIEKHCSTQQPNQSSFEFYFQLTRIKALEYKDQLIRSKGEGDSITFSVLQAPSPPYSNSITVRLYNSTPPGPFVNRQPFTECFPVDPETGEILAFGFYEHIPATKE